MRKAILMMLLAVVSSSAMAEWVVVTRSENGANTVYVDPATIRKAGNKVKMWELFDYKTMQAQVSNRGLPYMSSKSRSEYDCKEEQSRTLASSYHGENMGGGGVIYTDDEPGKWRPVSPESINEALWELACGKQPIPVMNNSAREDWVKVIDSNKFLVTFYADPTTIRKTGNKAKM